MLSLPEGEKNKVDRVLGQLPWHCFHAVGWHPSPALQEVRGGVSAPGGGWAAPST